jgi:hypothetical protein
VAVHARHRYPRGAPSASGTSWNRLAPRAVRTAAGVRCRRRDAPVILAHMRMLAVVATLLPCLGAQGAPRPQPLWNGVDLAGWHGQRHLSPYEVAAMTPVARAKQRAEDDASMRAHWRVENG